MRLGGTGNKDWAVARKVSRVGPRRVGRVASAARGYVCSNTAASALHET
jgi:hypothetical protein